MNVIPTSTTSAQLHRDEFYELMESGWQCAAIKYFRKHESQCRTHYCIFHYKRMAIQNGLLMKQQRLTSFYLRLLNMLYKIELGILDSNHLYRSFTYSGILHKITAYFIRLEKYELNVQSLFRHIVLKIDAVYLKQPEIHPTLLGKINSYQASLLNVIREKQFSKNGSSVDDYCEELYNQLLLTWKYPHDLEMKKNIETILRKLPKRCSQVNDKSIFLKFQILHFEVLSIIEDSALRRKFRINCAIKIVNILCEHDDYFFKTNWNVAKCYLQKMLSNVLIISGFIGDVSLQDEIQELKTVFEEKYNYFVERMEVTTRNAFLQAIRDHRNWSSITIFSILIVITHGGDENLCLSRETNERISISEIKSMYSDKPALLIFECCRGNETDSPCNQMYTRAERSVQPKCSVIYSASPNMQSLVISRKMIFIEAVTKSFSGREMVDLNGLQTDLRRNKALRNSRQRQEFSLGSVKLKFYRLLEAIKPEIQCL